LEIRQESHLAIGIAIVNVKQFQQNPEVSKSLLACRHAKKPVSVRERQTFLSGGKSPVSEY